MSDTFVCQQCGHTRKLANAVKRPCRTVKGRNVVSGFRLICGPCDAYAIRVKLKCERRTKREVGRTRAAKPISPSAEQYLTQWVHDHDNAGVMT